MSGAGRPLLHGDARHHGGGLLSRDVFRRETEAERKASLEIYLTLDVSNQISNINNHDVKQTTEAVYCVFGILTTFRLQKSFLGLFPLIYAGSQVTAWLQRSTTSTTRCRAS